METEFNFLRNDFSLVGNSKEKFLDDIALFNKSTIYQPMFNFRDLSIYHIDKDVGKYPDKIAIYNCMNTMNAIESVTDNLQNIVNIKPNFLKKEHLTHDLLECISKGEITTCFIYQLMDSKAIAFLDENARRTFASHIGYKGSGLYQKDFLADIILQEMCSNYKIVKDLPYGVYRKSGNINLLVSTILRKDNLVNMSSIEEINSPQLTLKSYKITNYQIKTEFEGEAVGDYIPIIRVSWSDAGKGYLKRELCVKPNDGVTKRSSILKDIPLNVSVSAALDDFKSIVSSKKIFTGNIIQDLTKDKRFRSIGDKRIKTIVKPMLKGIHSNQELFMRILTIPDAIGEVNETTDSNLEHSLGELFLRKMA